jgi:hypothetical protein
MEYSSPISIMLKDTRRMSRLYSSKQFYSIFIELGNVAGIPSIVFLTLLQSNISLQVAWMYIVIVGVGAVRAYFGGRLA